MADPEKYQRMVVYANLGLGLRSLPEWFVATLDDEDKAAYAELRAEVRKGNVLDIPEGNFG